MKPLSSGVLSKDFDWRELTKAVRWAAKQMKTGKKIFVEENGSDTFVLLAGENREKVKRAYKIEIKKQDLKSFNLIQVKDLNDLMH